MVRKTPPVLLAFLLTALCANADEAVYTDDNVSSSWQNWSWGSTIDFAATDAKVGTSSISVNSTAYSALSLYDTAVFSNFAGLKFDVSVCLSSFSPSYMITYVYLPREIILMSQFKSLILLPTSTPQIYHCPHGNSQLHLTALQLSL